MELREFIKETLVQIAQGVADAQVPAGEAGGYVSPAMGTSTRSESYFGTVIGGHPVFLIDFDVAVTASAGTAEAKVQVVSLLKLRAGGKSTQSQEQTSRVKFQVPMMLPIEQTTKEELEKRIQANKEAAERYRAQRAAGRTSWMSR